MEQSEHENWWRPVSVSATSTATILAIVARLGMTRALLRKRQELLIELRDRIEAASLNGKIQLGLKPPSFLMRIGDVLVYQGQRKTTRAVWAG
jgi:hypothetical protein